MTDADTSRSSFCFPFGCVKGFVLAVLALVCTGATIVTIYTCSLFVVSTPNYDKLYYPQFGYFSTMPIGSSNDNYSCTQMVTSPYADGDDSWRLGQSFASIITFFACLAFCVVFIASCMVKFSRCAVRLLAAFVLFVGCIHPLLLVGLASEQCDFLGCKLGWGFIMGLIAMVGWILTSIMMVMLLKYPCPPSDDDAPKARGIDIPDVEKGEPPVKDIDVEKEEPAPKEDEAEDEEDKPKPKKKKSWFSKKETPKEEPKEDDEKEGEKEATDDEKAEETESKPKKKSGWFSKKKEAADDKKVGDDEAGDEEEGDEKAADDKEDERPKPEKKGSWFARKKKGKAKESDDNEQEKGEGEAEKEDSPKETVMSTEETTETQADGTIKKTIVNTTTNPDGSKAVQIITEYKVGPDTSLEVTDGDGTVVKSKSLGSGEA